MHAEGTRLCTTIFMSAIRTWIYKQLHIAIRLLRVQSTNLRSLGGKSLGTRYEVDVGDIDVDRLLFFKVFCLKNCSATKNFKHVLYSLFSCVFP